MRLARPLPTFLTVRYVDNISRRMVDHLRFCIASERPTAALAMWSDGLAPYLHLRADVGSSFFRFRLFNHAGGGTGALHEKTRHKIKIREETLLTTKEASKCNQDYLTACSHYRILLVYPLRTRPSWSAPRLLPGVQPIHLVSEYARVVAGTQHLITDWP